MGKLNKEQIVEKYKHTKWYKRWANNKDIFDTDSEFSLVYDFENDEPLEFPLLAIEKNLVWSWKKDISSIHTPRWADVYEGKDNPRGKISKLEGTDWSYYIYDTFNFDMAHALRGNPGINPDLTSPYGMADLIKGNFIDYVLLSLAPVLKLSGKKIGLDSDGYPKPGSPWGKISKEINNLGVGSKDSPIQFGAYDIEVRGAHDTAKMVGPGLRFLIGIRNSLLDELPDDEKLLGGSPKTINMDDLNPAASIVFKIGDIDSDLDAMIELFKFYGRWTKERGEFKVEYKKSEKEKKVPINLTFEKEAENLEKFKSKLKEFISNASGRVKAVSSVRSTPRRPGFGTVVEAEEAGFTEKSMNEAEDKYKTPDVDLKSKTKWAPLTSMAKDLKAGAMMEMIKEQTRWGDKENIVEIAVNTSWEIMYVVEYQPAGKFKTDGKPLQKGGRIAIGRLDTAWNSDKTKNKAIANTRLILRELADFKSSDVVNKRTIGYISKLHGFKNGFKNEKLAAFVPRQAKTHPSQLPPEKFLKDNTVDPAGKKLTFTYSANPKIALEKIRKSLDNNPLASAGNRALIKESVEDKDFVDKYLSYLENWDDKIQDGFFENLPAKPKRLRLHDWPNTFDDIYYEVLNQADVQALVVELIRCLAPENWLYILCKKAMKYIGFERFMEQLQNSGLLEQLMEGNEALAAGLNDYRQKQTVQASEKFSLAQEKEEIDKEIEALETLKAAQGGSGDVDAYMDTTLDERLDQLWGLRQLVEVDQGMAALGDPIYPMSEEFADGLEEANDMMMDAIGNLQDPNLIDKICKNIIPMVKELWQLMKDLYAFFAGLPPDWSAKKRSLTLKRPKLQIDDLGKIIIEILRQMAAQAIAAAVLFFVKKLLQELIDACNNFMDWLENGDPEDDATPGSASFDDMLAENEDFSGLFDAMSGNLGLKPGKLGPADIAATSEELLNLMGDLELLFSQIELCGLFYGKPTLTTTTIIRNLILAKYEIIASKLQESDSSYITDASIIDFFSGFQNYIDNSFCSNIMEGKEKASLYEVCLPPPNIQSLKEDLLDGNATEEQIENVLEQNKLDHEALLDWALDMAMQDELIEPPPVFCGPDGPGLIERGSVGPTKFTNDMVLEQLFEPIDHEFRGDLTYFITKLTSKNTFGNPMGLGLSDETDQNGNRVGRTDLNDTWGWNDNMSEAQDSLIGKANRAAARNSNGIYAKPILFNIYSSLRNDRTVRHAYVASNYILRNIDGYKNSDMLDSYVLDAETPSYISLNAWRMAEKFGTQDKLGLQPDIGLLQSSPVILSLLPNVFGADPTNKTDKRYLLRLNDAVTQLSDWTDLKVPSDHKWNYIKGSKSEANNLDEDTCRFYGDLLPLNEKLAEKFEYPFKGSDFFFETGPGTPNVGPFNDSRRPINSVYLESFMKKRFSDNIDAIYVPQAYTADASAIFVLPEDDNPQEHIEELSIAVHGVGENGGLAEFMGHYRFAAVMHDEIVWGSARFLGQSFFFRREKDVKEYLYSLIPTKVTGIGSGCVPLPDGSILKVDEIKTKIRTRKKELECEEQQPKMGHDPSFFGLSAAEGMVLTIARTYAVETALRLLPMLWEMEIDGPLRSEALIDYVTMKAVDEFIQLDWENTFITHTNMYKRHHRPKVVQIKYHDLESMDIGEVAGSVAKPGQKLRPPGVYTEDLPIPAAPAKLILNKETKKYEHGPFHPKYQAHILAMANKIVFRLAKKAEESGGKDKDGNPLSYLADPFDTDDPGNVLEGAKVYPKEMFEKNPYSIEGFKFLMKTEIKEVSKFFGKKFSELDMPSYISGDYPNMYQWWLKNVMRLEAPDIYLSATNSGTSQGEYLGTGPENFDAYMAKLFDKFPDKKGSWKSQTVKAIEDVVDLKFLFEQDLHSHWMPRLVYKDSHLKWVGSKFGNQAGGKTASKGQSFGRFYAVVPGFTDGPADPDGDQVDQIMMKRSAWEIYGKKGAFVLEPYIKIKQTTLEDGTPKIISAGDKKFQPFNLDKLKGHSLILPGMQATADSHKEAYHESFVLQESTKQKLLDLKKVGMWGGYEEAIEAMEMALEAVKAATEAHKKDWEQAKELVSDANTYVQYSGTAKGAKNLIESGYLDLRKGAYLNLTDFIEEFGSEELYDIFGAVGSEQYDPDIDAHEFFDSWEYGLRLVYVFPLGGSWDTDKLSADKVGLWHGSENVPVLPDPSNEGLADKDNPTRWAKELHEYRERLILDAIKGGFHTDFIGYGGVNYPNTQNFRITAEESNGYWKGGPVKINAQKAAVQVDTLRVFENLPPVGVPRYLNHTQGWEFWVSMQQAREILGYSESVSHIPQMVKHYEEYLEKHFASLYGPTINLKNSFQTYNSYEDVFDGDDTYETGYWNSKKTNGDGYIEVLQDFWDASVSLDAANETDMSTIAAKNSYIIRERILHLTAQQEKKLFVSPEIYCVPLAEVNVPVIAGGGSPKLLRYREDINIYKEYPKEDLMQRLEEKLKTPWGKDNGLLYNMYDLEASISFLALYLIQKSYESEEYKDMFKSTKRLLRTTFYTCMLAQRATHDTDEFDSWELWMGWMCKKGDGPCGSENGEILCMIANMIGVAWPPDLGKLFTLSPLAILKILVMIIDPTWCKMPWTIPGIVMYYLNKLTDGWWDWDWWENDGKKCLPLPPSPLEPPPEVPELEKLKKFQILKLGMLYKAAGSVTDESLEDIILAFDADDKHTYGFDQTRLWQALLKSTENPNGAIVGLEEVFERTAQFLQLREELKESHHKLLNDVINGKGIGTPESPGELYSYVCAGWTCEDFMSDPNKEIEGMPDTLAYCLAKAKYINRFEEFEATVNEFKAIFEAAKSADNPKDKIEIDYDDAGELAMLEINLSEDGPYCQEPPEAPVSSDPLPVENAWEIGCVDKWSELEQSIETTLSPGTDIVSINGSEMTQTKWSEIKCQGANTILQSSYTHNEKRMYALILFIAIQELESGKLVEELESQFKNAITEFKLLS